MSRPAFEFCQGQPLGPSIPKTKISVLRHGCGTPLNILAPLALVPLYHDALLVPNIWHRDNLDNAVSMLPDGAPLLKYVPDWHDVI
jgi:hypothetical protein